MKEYDIPNHLAIIMDGNGRWAKQRGMNRSLGHLEGSKTLKKIGEYIFDKGVKVFSIFAFSTENFKRSSEEVNYLMNLFVKMFSEEFDWLIERNIKVVFSKKESGLPSNLEKLIIDITEKTKDNKNGVFNVCINYGGQDEIVDMTKRVCEKVIQGMNIEDINKEIIEENLYNKLPNIDLLIRTGGEYRISNFMLWKLSYSELYFTKTLFPDLNSKEIELAIEEFNNRERRFGGIKA